MIVDKPASSVRPRVMSGHRSTGRLHLGHLLGTLTNWVALGETAETFFEVADPPRVHHRFERPQAILRDGSGKARDVANATMCDVRRAMRLID